MKKDIKIFVSYHKPYELMNEGVLIPVHAGREYAIKNNSLTKKDLKWMLKNTIGDNTGENISIENPNYCELTTFYWIWKNIKADYIGHFQYRRILDICGRNYGYKEDFYNINLKDFEYKIIHDFIEPYDAVLSTLYPMDISVYEHYKRSHNINDLNRVIDIINEYYPQYTNSMDSYLQGYSSMFCNIFVMKKDLYNEFCTFIFDILDKVKPYIEISENPYQARVYGFLAERLYNIFIFHKIHTDPIFKFTRCNQIHILNSQYNVKLLGIDFTVKNSKWFNISGAG